MSNTTELSVLIHKFLADYDAEAKDEIWHGLSDRFRSFWSERVRNCAPPDLSDDEIDEVIRVLDRNGKGNTKDSEAVAKAMVPQGAWRRMFKEFRANAKLGGLVDKIFTNPDPTSRALAIDRLYELNAGEGNNLTGPSGNTVCALLAAYDPVENLSVISLKDRRAIIEFFGLTVPFDWAEASSGTRITQSNRIIINGLRSLGLKGSARTIGVFFYTPDVKPLWKGEHAVTTAKESINIVVPVESEDDAPPSDADTVRESMQVQGKLALLGALLGFKIWLPRNDRGRVLKVWNAGPGELVDALPLGYDQTTMKTIEQIDVLWLRQRSIVRAFEVEHTTSIYSGLLRMADLVALQPDIDIKLHIVAPVEKREKVLEEIRRPVFSLLEGRSLAKMCTYLSYDKIHEICGLQHIRLLKHEVVEEYEESADQT